MQFRAQERSVPGEREKTVGDEYTLCSVGDLADGTMRRFEVGGKAIALVNLNGRVYAIGDVCTHLRCPLSEGELDGDLVVCPCHGSMFDVPTGEVRGGPAIDPVPSYPVTVEGGEIRIRL